MDISWAKELLSFPLLARRIVESGERRKAFDAFVRFCNVSEQGNSALKSRRSALVLEGMLEERATGVSMIRRPTRWKEDPKHPEYLIVYSLAYYAYARGRSFHSLLIGSSTSGLADENGKPIRYPAGITDIFRVSDIIGRKIFIVFKWR